MQPKLHYTLLACAVLLTLTDPTSARTWSDDTGAYTIEADLIGFDEDHVVLKRAADGALGLVDTERLSAADEAYVAEQRVAKAAQPGEQQLWTLRGGLELPGRVVDFTRRDVTFQRRRGKVFVNDRVFENLPAVYRRIAPLIVGDQMQNQVKDEDSLRAWLTHLKGQPQAFTVDGVVMELASGDEYALPFFLFSESDLRLLRPGWEQWLAANGVDAQSMDSRAELSLALRTRAAQQQQTEEAQLQIAKLQLGVAAVNAGVTSLWEVTLYPGAGATGQPQWVVVPGRDSRVAQANALAQHPGYVLGPVRRVSR